MSRPFILAIMLAAATGMSLSAGSALLSRDLECQEALSEFETDINRRAAHLEREIAQDFEALWGVRALFKTRQNVSRSAFHDIAVDFMARHRDIKALEWIPRTASSERHAHELRGRRDGFKGYQITERNAQGEMVTADQRKNHYPVFYVEPLVGNEEALGYDLGSNPVRRQQGGPR